MSLWIRSQDGLEMILINNISVCSNDSEWRIITAVENVKDNIGLNLLLLGEYTTRGRCMKILDEIQHLLEQEDLLHIRKSSLNNLDDMANPKYILKTVGQPRIYEMPKE